jgi:hypothetical protein
MYIMMTSFIESDGLYKTSITETLYLTSFARECLLEIIVIDMVIFLRMVFASSTLTGIVLLAWRVGRQLRCAQGIP